MDPDRDQRGNHLTSASPSASRAMRWLAEPPSPRWSSPVHYATLLGGFLLLLYLTRSQWFWYDDWEFLGRGFAGHPLNLFFPHNEHWSTVPILIYKALFAVVGVRSYLPYMLVLLLLHVTAAHLLWRVMVRAGVDAWVAVALVGVFLVLGAGFENILWAFQIGFVGSLALGLLAVLMADRAGPFGRRDMLVWLVLTVGLMFSGIGVTMVAVAAIAVLFRRGPRAAIAILSVPAVVYIVWLVLIGHKGFGGIPFTKSGLLLLASFVWRGLTATADGLTGLVGFGAVAILGVFAWMVVRWRDAAAAAAPAFAMGAGAAVFFVVSGVGRASLGPEEAAASRYTYIASALLLPVIGLILTTLARRERLTQFAVVGLLVFCALIGLGTLTGEEHVYGVVKQQSKRQILAGATLISSGQRLIGTQPDPVFAPDLTVQELTQLVREDKLPAATGIADADRLNAIVALEVAAGTTPALESQASVTVAAGVGGRLTQPSGECLSALTYSGSYSVVLSFETAGYVEITSATSQTAAATLTASGLSGTSASRQVALTGSRSTYLSDSRASSTITLTVSATPIQVCGDVSEVPAPS